MYWVWKNKMKEWKLRGSSKKLYNISSEYNFKCMGIFCSVIFIRRQTDLILKRIAMIFQHTCKKLWSVLPAYYNCNSNNAGVKFWQLCKTRQTDSIFRRIRMILRHISKKLWSVLPVYYNCNSNNIGVKFWHLCKKINSKNLLWQYGNCLK